MMCENDNTYPLTGNIHFLVRTYLNDSTCCMLIQLFELLHKHIYIYACVYIQYYTFIKYIIFVITRWFRWH